MIINPLSRHNRDRPGRVGELGALVGESGEVVACATPETLDAALERFRDRRCTTLAICGGDGTLSFVLGAARRVFGDGALPRVAPLRGGTMNTVANGVGVPRRATPRLLGDLLRAVRSGDALTVRSFRCFATATRTGFLFGTGVVHGFMASYYGAGRGQPTPWTAAQVLAQIAASSIVGGPLSGRVASRLVATLTVDGTRVAARPYLTIMAGAVPEVGLGFRAFPDMRAGVDAFELLAIFGHAAQVASRLLPLRFGVRLSESVALDRLATEVIIESADGLVPHMIDGDLLEGVSPLVLRLGPAVQFVWGDGSLA